jgi:pimeloyl-ACP methyl ester carboxylesterase
MGDLTIPHDGVALSVTDDGDPDGPAVVLLHGLTAVRRYVVMGSSALPRGGHRVVGYDARGHGRSSPAPSPAEYRYEDLVGDLGAVLDGLEIDRAVFAGASMGAHTLLSFALAHPERVAGVVVITPAYTDRASIAARSARAGNGGERGTACSASATASRCSCWDMRWVMTVRTVSAQRPGTVGSPWAARNPSIPPERRPSDRASHLARRAGSVVDARSV